MSSIPRWMARSLALSGWLVVIPLVHGVLPWWIASFTRRFGWPEACLGAWNLLGLIPVTLGVVVLTWVCIVGMASTPQRVELTLTPSFLLLRGPYAFSRNPMYVAETGLWFGWALLLGSIGLLLAFLVLCSIISLIIVPREERSLEARFGQIYRDYKSRVPRFLLFS